MIGLDEVGRGPWAGPLLVCAVRLHKNIIGLKDSKKLSKTQRLKLNDQIIQSADIGYGWVSASQIDEIGLAVSIRLGFRKAYEDIAIDDIESIIIDGGIDYLDMPNSIAIIKADDNYPAVSAASIVAKVKRDEYMTDLANIYPGYGFDKHVGYGTFGHTSALQKYGTTPEHRRSFKPIAKILQRYTV